MLNCSIFSVLFFVPLKNKTKNLTYACFHLFLASTFGKWRKLLKNMNLNCLVLESFYLYANCSLSPQRHSCRKLAFGKARWRPQTLTTKWLSRWRCPSWRRKTGKGRRILKSWRNSSMSRTSYSPISLMPLKNSLIALVVIRLPFANLLETTTTSTSRTFLGRV